MSGPTFVGLDLGSTYFKAVGLTLQGEPGPVQKSSTPWARGQGPVRLDPLAVLELCRGLVRRAAGSSPSELWVGVTSMGETGVLVDGNGYPVGESVAWFDRSAQAELRDLTDRLGGERFALTTGAPLDHSRSVVKYLWCRRHLPEAASGRRWLSLAEWVAAGLGGGQVASEQSLLSRTGFAVLADGKVWPDALEAVGAPDGLVDPGRPCPEVSGDEPRVARAVVAGHDHPVAAYALSELKPGKVVVTCGTSLTVVTALAQVPTAARVKELISAGLTIGPGVGTGPTAYVVQGGTMGGLELSAKREATLARLGTADFEGVDNAAAQLLGRPKRDMAPGARPSAGVGQAAEMWAEAVMCAWGHIGELESATSMPDELGERVVCGGWAESAAFRRAAEVTAGGRTVRFSKVAEGGCTGAAQLAMARWSPR